MQKAKRWLGVSVSIFVILLVTAGSVLFYIAGRIPDQFTVTKGSSLDLSTMGLSARRISTEDAAQANAAQGSGTYQAQVTLFNMIPLKTVTVSETEEVSVVPGGTPFGIKLFTNGVVVVGVADISTAEGSRNPAEEAGLQLGDIIVEINGEQVTKTEMISEAMAKSGGAPVPMTIDRNGETLSITVTPVCSDYDGRYKGGIWVRDSTAGIGIVTFYRPETGVFAGLGHGICDVDTNDLMPLRTGEIVPVCISGVVKGQEGDAGELKGYFTSSDTMGQLYRNNDTGVYGTLNGAPTDAEPVPVAMKQEVEKGSAQVLTTIDGEAPKLYDIEIESLDMRDESLVKNMVVHITDPELLEKTGGIVQGMSGSPILQNGKLVGAVTHVFINDPERGYGIFAENMLQVSDDVTKNVEKLPDAA